MNATNEQNRLVGTLVIIGMLLFCFIAVPFGLAGFWSLDRLTYIVPAFVAAITLSTALAMSIRQKRISIGVVVIFIIGVLFLASGVIQFGFSNFEQNLSNHDRVEFYRMMRPDQVSRGLANSGMGIGLILVCIADIKRKVQTGDDLRSRRQKALIVVVICVGIFFLFFGIYTVISGLQPLSKVLLHACA